MVCLQDSLAQCTRSKFMAGIGLFNFAVMIDVLVITPSSSERKWPLMSAGVWGEEHMTSPRNVCMGGEVRIGMASDQLCMRKRCSSCGAKSETTAVLINNQKYILFLFLWTCLSWLQGFDGEEFLKCIRHLISIEKEWVPYSNKCSLYIRPTLIGTQVSLLHVAAKSTLFIPL